MNLHPLLVHFPVAILTIYALLECVRIKRLLALPTFWYFKAYSATIGTLAAYAAYAAGDERFGRSITDPVFKRAYELHTSFAALVLVIFSIIAVHYLIELLRRHAGLNHPLVLKVGAFIGQPVVLILLAILGLITLTITGGLGGSLQYGQNVDPIVSVIYKLFLSQ